MDAWVGTTGEGIGARSEFAAAIGRALAEHARDIVLLMDTSGSLVFANAAAENAYGHPAAVLETLNIRDLRADETLDLLPLQMRTANSDGLLFETAHRRADGSTFVAEVSSRGLQINDRDYLLSVVRDVSGRALRDAERSALLEDLEVANRQLDGLLTIVSRTVGWTDVSGLLEEVLGALKEVLGASSVLFLRREPTRWRMAAWCGGTDADLADFVMGLDEGFASMVAAAGEPLAVSDVTEQPTTIPFHAHFGLRAMVGVPLYFEGDLFGVLECAWTHDRLSSEGELLMLQVAADRIMSAIAGAQRFEATARARRLDAALSEASSLLAATHELDSALPAVLEIAAEALDSHVAVIGDYQGDRFEVLHAMGTEVTALTLPGHPDRVPDVHGSLPVVQVSRSAGTGEWLLDGIGCDEAVVVPVVVAGAWFGALVFGRRGVAPGYDEPALGFIRRLSSSLSLAYTSAREYESEHRIAETLQESMLRVDSSASGLEIGFLYRSATLSTRVGGDFYDVVPMTDGRVGVLIGDVSGKGLDAAVLTALVKHTVRAFAYVDTSPALIVERANKVLSAAAKLPEFASVLLLVIEPDSGSVAYTCAGHPAMVLVRADGSIERPSCGSPVIGAFPDLEFTEESLTLSPGDRVVLVTDGITEARRSSGEFFGDERLIDFLGQCPDADVDELPARLLGHVLAFTEGLLTDDIAVVALRLP